MSVVPVLHFHIVQPLNKLAQNGIQMRCEAATISCRADCEIQSTASIA